MGMSSSQPQPITQGTMGSPTKNYGPVGDMLGSAQNQVNPQSGPTDFTPGQGGMSGGMMPTNYTPQQQPMANSSFMPMGNAGFMPMGFGQMPTFGGPRGGKAPQGGGNQSQAMGFNPNTGRQVRAGYQGAPAVPGGQQTVAYQKQATDNYDGFYSTPYAYDPNMAAEDYGKIGAGGLGASAGFR